MKLSEYADRDGLALAQLIKKKEVSAREVTEAAIQAAEALNPKLNAVVYSAFEEALDNADDDTGDGPFAGVPFLIKDLDCPVGGWPMSSGSRFFSNTVGAKPDPEDGELTRRFRDAGLNFLGKTNTPEFGITGTTESAALGPCRSPWNTDHITGGSSGGSASAVAAGIVPLAHASDGLGSIRIPAACCGLVGMKNTRNRNPVGPYYAEASHGFVVDNVVSRSVRDSAAILDATGYRDPALPAPHPPKARPYLDEVGRNPGRLRIGFSTAKPGASPMDPQVIQAMEDVAKQLGNLGHEVEEFDIDIDWRAFYRAQGMKSGANFAAAMEELFAKAGRQPEEDEFEPLTWMNWKGAQRITGGMAASGTRMLYQMSAEIIEQLNPFDAYLMPVMTAPPPKIGHLSPVDQDPKDCNKHMGRLYPFTAPFNVTGQPAISLPLAWSDDGLPIGLQFIGRYGDEGTLFRLAAQLEDERPWADKRPALWAGNL